MARKKSERKANEKTVDILGTMVGTMIGTMVGTTVGTTVKEEARSAETRDTRVSPRFRGESIAFGIDTDANKRRIIVLETH